MPTSEQREASRLAEFLRLMPNQVENFQRNNPRFAPQSWWSYLATDSKGTPLEPPQWQFTQGLLKEAWTDKFELDLVELTRLLLSVFDISEQEAWLFHGDHRPQFATLQEIADDWGFHIGVRYLAEHPWAAEFCRECARPFVKKKPAQKYCFIMGKDGLHCAERVIKRGHLKWWNTKGSKQRKAKAKRR